MPFFVNVYELDRHYGGPEEGGWYYDSGAAVRSHPVPKRALADRLAATLRARYDADKPRYPVSSVCYQGGEFGVCVERHPARSYPAHRPHYE
jgi:hypothetical protein